MTLYFGWCDLLAIFKHECTHMHMHTHRHINNSEFYDWSTDMIDSFMAYFCLNRFELTTHLQDLFLFNFIEELKKCISRKLALFIIHINKVNCVECFKIPLIFIILKVFIRTDNQNTPKIVFPQINTDKVYHCWMTVQ